MPEKALKKLNTYILPQWKVCFFAALLAGLMAHLYKITNWLPNWDSLVFRYDGQNMVALGRWFLPVVCAPSSFYDLPFLSGMLAIVFHALSAVLVCKMLGVQGKIPAALIGAVIVCFPTVTSVMMYNYVADGYSIAFFLSTLAAVFMTKEKPRYLLSAVLIALSAGIYQAYLTVTVMLLLLHLLDELVFKGAPFGAIVKKSVCMLLSGVLGVVLYSVVLNTLLRLLSLELLDYQGVSAALSLATLDLPASLYAAKETFRKCFFDTSGGISLYVVLNGFVLLFTLAAYIAGIVKNKIFKKPANLLLAALLSVALLFAPAALAFVNPAVDYHNLMRMGYCVFYLFFLLLYERNAGASKRWVILLTALVLTFNQIVISNVSYHKAQMAYEKSYGVLVRIADRIEQTAGAEECDKLLVIGALDNSRAYSVNLPPDITGITDGYIIRADDESVGQSVFCSALNDYCGKDYAFLAGAEKDALLQREDVKSMEKWPAQNCVGVVEDILVVKLGTEGER